MIKGQRRRDCRAEGSKLGRQRARFPAGSQTISAELTADDLDQVFCTVWWTKHTWSRSRKTSRAGHFYWRSWGQTVWDVWVPNLSSLLTKTESDSTSRELSNWEISQQWSQPLHDTLVLPSRYRVFLSHRAPGQPNLGASFNLASFITGLFQQVLRLQLRQ